MYNVLCGEEGMGPTSTKKKFVRDLFHYVPVPAGIEACAELRKRENAVEPAPTRFFYIYTYCIFLWFFFVKVYNPQCFGQKISLCMYDRGKIQFLQRSLRPLTTLSARWNNLICASNRFFTWIVIEISFRSPRYEFCCLSSGRTRNSLSAFICLIGSKK